jgi:hypothetical protein
MPRTHATSANFWPVKKKLLLLLALGAFIAGAFRKIKK